MRLIGIANSVERQCVGGMCEYLPVMGSTSARVYGSICKWY